MQRNQAIVVAAAGIFLGLVLLLFLHGGGEAPGVKTAPVFELPGPDGTRLSLSSLRGRTVLVNFWATWCPPCIEETPSLVALHRKLGPRGLVLLGVAVDETWEPVTRVARELAMTYPVLLDPGGSVARRYGTMQFPETYLIDGEGKVLRKYVGAVDWSLPEVSAEIEGFLTAVPKRARAAEGDGAR